MVHLWISLHQVAPQGEDLGGVVAQWEAVVVISGVGVVVDLEVDVVVVEEGVAATIGKLNGS